MGMTAVVGDGDVPVGIFTDGDLRRALEKGCDVRTARVSEVMTRSPRSIGPGALAVEAAEVMERVRITQLLVLDESGGLAGALTTHDLMLAKVI
jgi:arabinose-5-phosphate isomerase